MRPMAAAAVGALISGIAVYAVGARAAQNPFAEMPALVQTVDGRYIQVPDARTVGFPTAAAPMGFVTTPGYVATQPATAPRVVSQSTAPARVYRTAAPTQDRVVVRETEDVRRRLGRIGCRRRRPDGRQEGRDGRCSDWRRRSLDIRGNQAAIRHPTAQ